MWDRITIRARKRDIKLKYRHVETEKARKTQKDRKKERKKDTPKN